MMKAAGNGNGVTSHEFTTTKISLLIVLESFSRFSRKTLRTPMIANGISRAMDHPMTAAIVFLMVMRRYSASLVCGGSFTTTTDVPYFSRNAERNRL